MLRLVAVLLILACASGARAGVIISLVPDSPPEEPWSDDQIWYYNLGQIVMVEVFAKLDSNGPESIQIRSIQLDLGNTSPVLSPDPAITHVETMPPIAFWDFSSTEACQGDLASCGRMHLFDGSLALDNLLEFNYLGVEANAMKQITLTQSHSERIGLIYVLVGDFGPFQLDLVNYWNTDPSLGAHITYGFGGPNDPAGTFSTIEGSITGGHVILSEIPEPATFMLLLAGTLLIRRSKAPIH